ncbi:MAG: hypothetical protein R3282_07055, partial [Rhodothermales bacterium]|nr:hypothetical protein [Rhodothermales bacterium]
MRYVLVLATVLLARVASAQTDGILQLNDPVHRYLERQWTLGNLGASSFITHQPLSLPEARAYLDSLDAHSRSDLSQQDRYFLDRFLGNDPAPGATWANERIGKIYGNGNDFAAFTGDGYSIQVNPLLYLSYGIAKQSERPDRDESISVGQNTRGIRLSGHIGDHVFFETRFEENQVKLPDLAGPVNGDRRGFAYRDGDNTFDYGVATGVIGFRSRFFEARFGQDRHRWPATNGSLVLSNYSPPFAFLQLRTTVGPFQYKNHFASLQDARTPRGEGELIKPFKYGAFHRLAYQPSSRVELGIFESIILAPTDDELDPGFFFTFLNPVVLLHTLNLDLGSPGNVLLGIDARWRIRDGLAVDGQFFVDDLEISEFFSNPDYWKNTYGLQLGVSTVDLA